MFDYSNFALHLFQPSNTEDIDRIFIGKLDIGADGLGKVGTTATTSTAFI